MKLHKRVRFYLEKNVLTNFEDAALTKQSKERKDLESCILEKLIEFCENELEGIADEETAPAHPQLHTEEVEEYLCKGLHSLPMSFECLDSSKPWLLFWILHSLSLLRRELSQEDKNNIIAYLSLCQSTSGGFGGGPGQRPHLASTYAAVNALCTLQCAEAYAVIDRSSLFSFLHAMRLGNGGFHHHQDGEVDIRAVYCALSVSRLLNIFSDALFDQTAQWLVSCQTYEGGFSGVPGMEAHGGYSFCGFASLIMLNHERLCDVDALLRWTVNRQLLLEGGFNGRSNKLVDSCYSFWVGALLPLISQTQFTTKKLFSSCTRLKNDECKSPTPWLFDEHALQEYILICCQKKGGFVDKPNNRKDYYHTCYALSGLSISQHCPSTSEDESEDTLADDKYQVLLRMIHPIYNITYQAEDKAKTYFSSLPSIV